MTKTEVLDLLKEHRDARGEASWKEMGDRTGGLTSFGIGLTRLRAIAKQVGRDHDLALKLWNEAKRRCDQARKSNRHQRSEFSQRGVGPHLRRTSFGSASPWAGRMS